MSVSYIKLKENNMVILHEFDYLEDDFLVCILNNSTLIFQQYDKNKKLSDNQFHIHKQGNIVKNELFYNLVKITNSHKCNYFYIPMTNSYMPTLKKPDN